MNEWSRYIDEPTVLNLYLRGIEEHGGLGSQPKANCVPAVLGNAWSAHCYQEESEGYYFAAALLFYFVKRHCFADGNKRLAWSAFVTVLACMNLTVQVEADDAIAFVNSIAAESGASVADVVEWVTNRLVAFDSQKR